MFSSPIIPALVVAAPAASPSATCTEVLRALDAAAVPATPSEQKVAKEAEIQTARSDKQQTETDLATLRAAATPDLAKIKSTEDELAVKSAKLDHLERELDTIEKVIQAIADDPYETEASQQEASSCNLLFTSVATELFPGLNAAVEDSPKPTPRKQDVEPARLSPAGAQGSPASGQAAASSQPVPQAGIAGAFVGTPTGPRLLTGLTANPLGLATSTSGDVAQYAWMSRAFDFGVLLPADLTPPETGAGRVDYVGVRLRFNAFAWSQADKLMKAVDEAYTTYQVTLAQVYAEAIELLTNPRLTTPAERKNCFNALRLGQEANIEAACKAPLESLSKARTDEQAAIRSVRAVRRTVDQRYLGIEVGYDQGDPSFSGLSERQGHYLAAYLSGGYRVPNQVFQVRGSVGADYAHLVESDTSRTSIVWQAGAELAVPPHSDHPVSLSGSVEGSYGDSDEAPELGAGTRYTGTVALSAPVYRGSRFAVTVQFSDDGESTVATTFDWASLLQELRPQQ